MDSLPRRRHRHYHSNATAPFAAVAEYRQDAFNFVRSQLAPDGRWIEAELLVGAFTACLVMWLVARRVRRSEDYLDGSAADALVAQSHELSLIHI